MSAPSVRVLNSLAQALDLSAEVLLDQAGLLRDVRFRRGTPQALDTSDSATINATEAAIKDDRRLSAAQKNALLAVYDSYVLPGQSGQSGQDD